MSFLKSISLQFSFLGRFWQEKINNVIFRWNLFFIICQLIVIVFKFNSLPPQVPLYYSLPWGESQLGNASSLFLLPTFSIVILLLNNLLANFFLKSIPLLSRLLIIVSVIFSFFLTFSLLKIFLLVS